MKLLLAYLPFCTPASPPYSLTALASFLEANSTAKVTCLDLNLEFHRKKFPQFQEYFRQSIQDDYDTKTQEYFTQTKSCYSRNNTAVVNGETPEYFQELLDSILSQKPDVVAFSIVYSSQAFYAYALLKELKKQGISTVIGGPCVNSKLTELADHYFRNEVEFLAFLEGKSLDEIDHDALIVTSPLDFSGYSQDYFTPVRVIPLKTSTTCYYKQCQFCSHYAKVPYQEYPLSFIRATLEKAQAKQVFLIDDMVPQKRLLELAVLFKQLHISWACQLKPTKDLDAATLQTLADSGLTMVIWGVESGSQEILDRMKKGTKAQDVGVVLHDAHAAGIKNVLYIMFGFPGETKETFLETIEFLEAHADAIDLLSTSQFGLQHGTPVYNNPSNFGIVAIEEVDRTVLEPKISYRLAKGVGLDASEVKKLRRKYQSRLDALNKYPKSMNFFREHMIGAERHD